MRALLLAAAASLAVSAASAQTFTFSTLDNPADPTFNQLLGINDHGTIVGYFGSTAVGHPNIGYEISPPYTKFVSNNQPGSVQTQATGINNAGYTAGFWSDTNLGGGDANFAFLRAPIGHNFTYVSTIDPDTGSVPRISQALGINNSNVVAGFFADANGATHGFTYTLATGAYTTFNANNASVAFTGINDSGTTCGTVTTAQQITYGFTRNASGGVFGSFRVPGSKNTQLLGINNEGVTVGFYTDGNNLMHGLYYVPATGNWLRVDDPDGVQGTVINGLNNKNELVGFYTDAAGNVHGMVVTVQP